MSILTESVRPIWLAEHEECDKMFTPQVVVYMVNIKGKIQITVCPTCGYEDVQCLHLNNKIDQKLATITCLLCGG